MAQQDIIDELNYLKETKQQIKQAIIDKGQDVYDETPFREYAGKISAIAGDNIIDTEGQDVSVSGSTLVFNNTLPYTELEYIESTGTQYIDTFIQGNNTTKVDIRFDSSKYSASSENCVLGSRVFSGSSIFILGFYSRGWYGYGTSQGSPMLLTGGIYEVRLDKGKFYSYNTTTSEWELKNTYTSETFTTPSNMILFGERRGNTVSQLSSIKFYYCKIFNNDILVRDYIPVKRKSDDEICMYDKVTNQFFTNQGTGNFIAGPEI